MMRLKDLSVFNLIRLITLVVVACCFISPAGTYAKASQSTAERVILKRDLSKGISFTLPVNNPQTDDWWNQTELNVIAIIDNPFEEITIGEWGAAIVIPDNSLADGIYYFEGGLQRDPDNPNADGGDATAITVKNGGVIDSDRCYHENGMSYLYMSGRYSYLKQGGQKGTVRFIFKTHTECSVSGKEIFITAFMLNDYKCGATSLSISDGTVKCQKVSYYEGKRSEWSYKIEAVGRKIYCDNLPEIMYLGEKLTLKVGTDIYGTQSLTYSSSNSKVATISSKGKITVKAVGKTTITVKDKKNNVSLSVKLEVKKPYLDIEYGRSRTHVGTIFEFVATAKGYKSQGITWKSSDTSVGTVDKNTGKFTAKKVGKTTVTATDAAGYKSKFEVEVYDDGNAEVIKYITMHSNPEAGPKLEEMVYNHLLAVYANVYEMFGDGNYHYIDVYFEHIDFAAAYATLGYSEDHNEIHIGIETLTSNMNDLDCVTHELIHTAQNYSFSTRYGEDRTWLGEGLTDYGRYLLGVQNEKAGWSLGKYVSGQEYTDSYNTTASFIKYVVEVHDSAFAKKLNEALRKGEYTEKLWKDRTGYTIDELWEKYKKW